MATFRYELHNAMPDAVRDGVVTIGNFDGVHLGHQALLSAATQLGRPAVAVTFDPHVSHLLRPDRVQPPLTTMVERARLLHQYGIDHVLILQTTADLLDLSARDFFERILIERLRIRGMVEGYNFAFGHGREGTTEVLAKLCGERHLPLTLISPCEMLGQPVSSTRVRAGINAGAVDTVQQLLGRPYRIEGIVGIGQKRGAGLGFPTANVHEIATLLPAHGVYAALALHAGRAWPAAVNVGPNPTFGETARKVEAHLLDFKGDLYDQPLTLDFIARIRDTRAFASVSDLVAQIEADVAEVKKRIGG